MKRMVVKIPAKLPYLIMGYKVPVVKTTKKPWEPYALEVLAWVLDGGGSARFSNELIRGKQIASSASASYDPFDRLQTLFLLHGRPSQGKSVDVLEKEFRAQLKKLKTTLVSKKELDRVKAQVVAQNVFKRDSYFYKAMVIGQMETVGYSWKLSEKFVDNIKKVTPEQIREVAQKYFKDESLTVGHLDPQPLTNKKKRVRPAIKGGRHGH